jgi:hypothetical protein
VLHPGRHHVEAIALEAADDLADQILGDGIGFDNGKGTLNSHVYAPDKNKKNV